MTPDFEYFIRMKLLSHYSHTWQGLFWFDVPLGIMLVIIYEFWIKDPLITHLPTGLNRRFSIFGGYRDYYSLQYLCAIFISVLLGAASHLAWDGFTHASGFFVQQIPRLKHIIRYHGHRLHLYTCLQYASTIAGTLFILALCYFLPKQLLTRAKQISGFWLQFTLVAMVTVAIKLATGLQLHQYGDIAITLIDGGLLGLIVASVLNQ